MIATDPIECVWLSGGSVRVTLFAVLGEVESLVFDILRDTASHQSIDHQIENNRDDH